MRNTNFFNSTMKGISYLKKLITAITGHQSYITGHRSPDSRHVTLRCHTELVEVQSKGRSSVNGHQSLVTRPKTSHRAIAMFFVLTFLNTLVPYNQLWANNNGPNAPEAAAFEPVDATDMVNLSTGDLTYTMPLVNIPGSNGGYPLALAYHAGISTDQESSWVGLGWSLNPGAINRSVNRLPDDWKEVNTFDYYWNEGETYRQHTINVTIPLKGVTIGLGASWGNLRGFGGSISAGVGNINVTIGTDGVGISYGKGPFSIGTNLNPMEDSFSLNAGLRSNINGFNSSIGLSYNNKSGLAGYGNLSYSGSKGGLNYYGSVGLTTQGTFSYSLGASISTKIGNSKYSIGSGFKSFTSSVKNDDLTIDQSGYTIPLIVASYTYEKVRVYLDESKNQVSTGSLYKPSANLDNLISSYCQNYAELQAWNDVENYCRLTPCTEQDRQDLYPVYVTSNYNRCIENPEENGFEYYRKLDNFEDNVNHITATEYDNYAVTGQGIYGNMTPHLMGNSNLAPYDSSDIIESELRYYSLNDQVNRFQKTEFAFRSSINHRAQINPVIFSDNLNPNSLENFIVNPSEIVSGDEKSGKSIQYYTFDEVEANPNLRMPDGFTKPESVQSTSIAGFVVTSTDGISYHYMLPVYNHLTKVRNNHNKDNPRSKYSESTKPAYATHWLLTGVTGPDYFDYNSNQKVDQGDYGYWVNFDYGKWSDGMVWRNPADLSIEHDNSSYSYMWGIKDVYYLDKVNTNTHTALFIKDLKLDAKGIPVTYIDKNAGYDSTMPVQKQLLLDQIVLLKNEDAATVSKQNQQTLAAESSFTFYDPISNKNHILNLNQQDNILDNYDQNINQNLIDNAISVIDMDYDYSLAPNSPNTDANGKLALKKIYTHGEGGADIVPPYEFVYDNNPQWSHDIHNVWGYNQDNPAAWSLSSIKLPLGSSINIQYETDEYESLSATDDSGDWLDIRPYFYSSSANNLYVKAYIGSYNFQVGDVVKMTYTLDRVRCGQSYISTVCNDGECAYIEDANFIGLATVTNVKTNTDGTREASFDADISQGYTFDSYYQQPPSSCSNYEREAASFRSFNSKTSAGIRVSEIALTDNINTWKTTYTYQKGDIPYEPVYDMQVRDQFFLASPIVMYPEVTVTKMNAKDEVQMTSIYKYYTHRDEGCIEDNGCTRINKNKNVQNFENRLNYNSIYAVHTDIDDFQSYAGLLKSVVHKSSKGKRTYEELNTYKTLDKNSGFVPSESFQLYKSISSNNNSTKNADLWSTTVNHYPVVLEKKEVKAGSSITTELFEDLDPYTGTALTQYVTVNQNPTLKSTVVPAREKYPTMGSKKVNPQNANMLDQTVASYSYIENEQTGTYDLLATSIQTWYDQWIYRDYKGNETNAPNSVWRKHKNYSWIGSGTGLNSDGTIADPVGATSFNWWYNQEPPTNSGWLKTNTIKRYNKYSAILESEDKNGDYVATKYNYDNSKVIATSNTEYKNFYYASFEDYDYQNDGLSGEMNQAIGRTGIQSHTGKNSFSFSGSWNALKTNDYETGKYKISFWSYGSAEFTVNNNNPDETIKAGNWKLNNFYLDLTSGQNVTISGTGYIDDFRMHPAVKSGIKCFVYDDKDHLTEIINNSGFATRYFYNAVGQLTEVWQEVGNRPGLTGGFKKINEHRLNYANGN
ncbi:YD repeat-containing protein [Aquimarina brevivitae]|uniref:YD repeat-containing protein n=2 Tax=Aquimarina brevivitae TaxID=323412 RepID=A0A4Q7P105_9FLAO|nr:YD repeat-containing protein [Aquimarina brevivitae]